MLGTTRAESASSTVELLRAHTRAAHERLDDRLARFDWLATPETYAAMLERFYGFYVRAEPQLAAIAAALPGLDLERRRKVPLLVADLTHLGRTPQQLRALPRVGQMPRVDDPARALGALYVVEGATLGGKLIEQAVEQRLGLDRTTGTAFFGAYGADDARQWKRFGTVLEREAIERGSADMCEAAGETFAVLDAWLVT
jgi:heme oxygenase